jgi:hypothetical protein
LYASAEPPTGLADFMAISHLNAPGKVTEWASRPGHLSWISGGQKPIFLDAKGALEFLSQPAFDPRRVIVLPTEAAGSVTVTNHSNVRISSPKFLATTITFSAEASEAALVGIAQTYHPAWKAYVDGKAVKLRRANHAFQAVEVPAGNHQVQLRYEDKAFFVGAALSGLALIISAAMWVRSPKTKVESQSCV